MHRTIRALIGVSAAVLTAIAVGCGTRESAEATRPGGNEPGAPAPQAKPKPTVELAQVRYDALAEAIKKQKGNVVVIDMWATY